MPRRWTRHLTVTVPVLSPRTRALKWMCMIMMPRVDARVHQATTPPIAHPRKCAFPAPQAIGAPAIVLGRCHALLVPLLRPPCRTRSLTAPPATPITTPPWQAAPSARCALRVTRVRTLLRTRYPANLERRPRMVTARVRPACRACTRRSAVRLCACLARLVPSAPTQLWRRWHAHPARYRRQMPRPASHALPATLAWPPTRSPACAATGPTP